MTAAIALMPDWFCVRYAREELSFLATLLAVVQWIARLALMPLNLTWEALLSLDTKLFEIGAIFSEVAFLAWIWVGTGHPHPVVLQTMPAWAWTLLVLPLAIGHVSAFARRNRDTRAIALIIDASGYLWALLNVLRGRFNFAEVFLWAFLVMGVIAVFSLHRKGTADGAD